jgi:hypothetical protein
MAVAMLLLYMAYYWAPQMNSGATLRFLMPTYALYILAGLWLLEELCRSMGGITPGAVGLGLIAFQLLWGTSELRAETDQLHYQKESLARVTVALEQAVRPGDVVAGSGSILPQLDFVRKWKVADGTLMRGAPGLGGRGGPGMPVGNVAPGSPGTAETPGTPSPRQVGKVKEQREKYSSDPAERERKWAADVSAWAGPDHKIYVVGTQQDIDDWKRLEGATIRIVGKVALPAMPEDSAALGRLRGFGGLGRRGAGGAGRRGLGAPGAGIPGPPAIPGAPGFPGGAGPLRGPMGGFAGETEVIIAEMAIAAGHGS